MAVQIVSVSPANNATGVPVQTQIEVVFDKPLDQTSIGYGSLFVESADKAVLSGPFNPVNYPLSQEPDVFTDPAYFGLVTGSYSCQFEDTQGNKLSTSYKDTSGTDVYRTRVIFKPTFPLTAQYDYKIYVVGTSTGDLKLFGIKARTVFDPSPGAGNTGNGTVFTWGGYDGTTTGTYTIQITKEGVVGVATYKWKLNNEAFSSDLLTHIYTRRLSFNVGVSFDVQGTYKLGDTFTFPVKPADYLSAITISSFRTGDAGTQLYTSATSTSILPTVAPSVPSLQPGLALLYTIPANFEADIDSTTTAIKLFFNKPLDPSSTSNFDGYRIYIGPPNGDTSIRSETSYRPNKIEIQNQSTLILHLERI